MTMRHFLPLLALAVAAACEPRPAERSTTAPAPDSAPVAVAAAPPAPPPPTPAGGTPAPPVEAPPSRADSLAGAARDLSPEWIERSRTMADYRRCMAQAEGLPPEVRPRVEAGCTQRAGAPR